MKKYLIISAIALVAVACGSNSSETKKDDAASATAATTAADDISQNPDYQKGLALVAKNDCLTCHKIDQKVTGPAYRDVANKYTDKDIPTLAQKVIKGGQGNWGQIPMTPHPNLSEADAEQMVKYILLLKK
ncbi:MAG: c-type cytochrome [Bacteroidota bacterium]|nr:c-type cytochrome [Bacteroidota bacterium]